MRQLLLALFLTLGSFATYGQAPDCQFTQTFTATGYGDTVSLQAVANIETQCTTWRLSYYAVNMTALSIQVEGAPDTGGSPGSFAAVPTTACSSTVQPPCTLDGANPLTDANHATVAFRGYYAWIALDVTVFTASGSPASITARMYGYKGTSPAAAVRGGSGGSAITALTGDVTATGPGSAAATVVKINGGSVPASAHVLGTNASSQPIISTATDLSTTIYVAGGGIAQAQTAALAPAVTALTNGLTACWLPIAANTAAAPTLKVNATAAKPITKLGATALVANDLTTTAVACAIYDGTEYQLQNPQTVGSGGPFVPYTGATGDVALGAHGITGAPFTGDSGAGGTTGLVPAPASGDAAAGKYLAAGGGFSVPPGTGVPYSGATTNVALGVHGITGAPFTGDSGAGGTTGLVPAPAAGDAAAGKYLAAGGGYSVPPTGGAGTPGATVFSSTSTVGPDDSAAETSVIGVTATASTTIAANTFTNGAVLQAHAQGFFSLPAIADSLTLKMKCGSTVIGSAVLTPGAGVLTNGSWRFWLDITARGTGAGGSFITNSLVELTGSALIDTTAQVLNTTTVAYDFTTACVFDVTAQWGAAQVGETIKGTNVAAWFPGAPVTSIYGLTGAVLPTAHNESSPLTCAAASSSSTTYSCSTSPTFTPSANDCVLLVADVASGASPTLAVNGAAAHGITKQQNGAALVANDLLANGQVLVCMDAASHWQMQGQIGNATSGAAATPDILNNFIPSGTIGNEVHKNLSILDGATSTILSTVTAAGYISELFIATDKYNTEVIVTVDGEATPQIDANVADLLGDHYADTQPASFNRWITVSNAGSGNVGGTFKIPIPFSSSVTVQVKNNSGSTIIITSHIIYHTAVPNTWPNTQHLHLAFVNASGIVPNAETDLLNVTPNKHGKLMGIGWIYDAFPGSASPAWAGLEGAFKIYIDGAGSPNYATGGSEDFFGAPWYFHNVTSFGTGSSSTMAPQSSDLSITIITASTWGAQRFFIQDPIAFTTGLRVTWTCGNTSAVSLTGTCEVISSVYYYTEN